MAPPSADERYRLALLGSDDGIWDWDLGGEMYLCPRWKALLGLAADDGPSHPRDWLERVHPDDQSSLRRALDEHLSGRSDRFHHEHRLRHEDGSYRRMLCRGRAIRERGGRALRVAGTMTDVTDRVAVEESLRQAALHDGLTGLPNRALLRPRLLKAIERRRRRRHCEYALLFIDVDRFKTVNDTYGHATGDALLNAVARRLEGGLRATDTPCRYSGDEFVALLGELDSPLQAVEVATRLHAALRAPYHVAGRELLVSASVGGVVGADRFADPEALLAAADAAMYRAKAAGHGRPVLDGLHA
jgi:diguanylate cyclase (GGDEF)-like protein/PAS domain S-box-containing protein